MAVDLTHRAEVALARLKEAREAPTFEKVAAALAECERFAEQVRGEDFPEDATG